MQTTFEKKDTPILRPGLTAIGIAVITFLLFQQIPFLKNLESILLDQFIVLSGERQPGQKMVVIVIDDKSVSRLGTPVSRSHYVKLIRKLLSLGAKTIVFDLLFCDERNPDIDSRLAFVTDSTDHVVHCFAFSEDEPGQEYHHDIDYQKFAIEVKGNSNSEFISVSDGVFPYKQLLAATDQAGFSTTLSDPDGRVRRIPLFIEFKDSIYPALTLVTLFDYFDVKEKSIEIEEAFWGRNAVIETPTELIRIPINSAGQVLLNFYGIMDLFEPMPLFEIIDLLDALHDPKASEISLPLFDNKIVFIGTTEMSVDKHSTPFSSVFPGVGFHATLISNILQDTLLTEASWKLNGVISAIMTLLLLGTFIYYFRFSISTRAFVISSIGLLIFFNLAGYFFFFKYCRIWLKVLQIDGAFIILFISLLFYEKVIRLKELKIKVIQLENEIFTKSTNLEIIDRKITSQSEQFNLVQYFTAELQTIFKSPALKQREYLEKVFLRLFENQEIIKEELMSKIEQLRSEQQEIEREREQLEFEKNSYENILKGEKRVEAKEIPATPKIDKAKAAGEILAAYHFFQAQQKKGFLQRCSIWGIVSVPAMVNAEGQTPKTAMGEIFEKIKRMSSFDSTVLITGDHGTGKELVARAVHEQSKRADKRLMILNCAAIPDNLLESELFGHVKGAFTHAISDRMGAFEYADGGTIFLDEIGDLKLDVQAKLLRVLQDKEFQKVGSNKTLHVDVRVITATNKNLVQCVKNNEFRDDLYFRLNVVNLHIPRLSERKCDVPFLIHHFLTEFNSKYSKAKSFSDEAIMAAMCYDWPGNIRMLQHLVESVCVMTAEKVIALQALPDDVQAAYRNIFESSEVSLWEQIEDAVQKESQRLLDACKAAIKEERIDDFLRSTNLKIYQQPRANCYEFFLAFVDGMASLFPSGKRESLVRKTIVKMQDQLFQWCRETRVAKLGELYDKIEKILGRSRRQIDNWRKG